MIDWRTLPRPMMALAPMADLTDQPFCRICREVSGDSFVIFRQMVSSVAVVRGNAKTLRLCEIEKAERPIVHQIFGSEPETMARAAQIIERKFKPDGLDINMGCPAKKIISNFDGASLMRDPQRAAAIIKAVKAAVSVPVSVKTRLGWSRPDEILEFAKVVEQAGADLLTIHGRTREQGYAGNADWEMIGRVKKEISIPLLLNGDVVDAESAKRALAISQAHGLMIGRGALGNPWIFGKLSVPSAEPSVPSHEDRVGVVLRHARYQVERYGERGLAVLRKHLPYYFKGHDGTKELRAALVRVSTYDDLARVLAG